MVIRGETTAQEFAAIAEDDRFRIKPVSGLLSVYEGPNAPFMRFLATEPTLPDALRHPVDAPEHGIATIEVRRVDPAAQRAILEALNRGDIEITDEAEEDRGIL